MQPEKEQSQSQLSGKELYELKKKEKLGSKENKKTQQKFKQTSIKIGQALLLIAIGVGIIGLVIWWVGRQPFLPPITDDNHIEVVPAAHVLTQPMPDRVQRHMLEHADGQGRPGVIIQYNCDDYECGSGLVDNLTELVNQYPDNVYLAPNNYDGKIILTRLGKREILNEFNEEKIRAFIER